MDRHTLSNGRITATIKCDGAELCSLQNAAGQEVLWQAGEAWPRHAPILFPVVGRLKGDVLRHHDKSYPMSQHGFARDMRFDWTTRAEQHCVLTLRDDAATREHFPFAFELTVTYAVRDDELVITYEIANTGNEMMPASIGAHPGFAWPLPGADDKASHTIVFSDAEPAPIRRVEGGLLRPPSDSEPTPVEGGALALSEQLFVEDAIVIDHLASTSLRYMAPGAPTIDIAWEGFHQLGIWSKPTGAPFLCIEPWLGYASQVDFDGEFSTKPGVVHIAVGATHRVMHRIGFS